MSQIPKTYDRKHPFGAASSNNPSNPIQGTDLDAEFNAVELSMDETQARLAQIQRDDGALANLSVGVDQFSQAAGDYVIALAEESAESVVVPALSQMEQLKADTLVLRGQAVVSASASQTSASASQVSATAAQDSATAAQGSAAAAAIADAKAVAAQATADAAAANAATKLDASANAVSATKLVTPRNVNGVSFDGTTDITVADATKEPTVTLGTSTQFWRGDKTWTDFATTVRATVLTGLTVVTNSVALAADTALVAIGKLQAQITARLPLAGGTMTGTLLARASTTAAGTAPIKLPTGVKMTTPESGAFEFDGTLLYFTVGGVRKTVTLT